MTTPKKSKLTPLDTEAQWSMVVHQAALEAAVGEDDQPGTSRWAEDVCKVVQGRISEMRWTSRYERPIPVVYTLLDRQQLLAQIEVVRSSGHVSYAHFDANGLSDNDLRRLLQHLEDSSQASQET